MKILTLIICLFCITPLFAKDNFDGTEWQRIGTLWTKNYDERKTGEFDKYRMSFFDNIFFTNGFLYEGNYVSTYKCLNQKTVLIFELSEIYPYRKMFIKNGLLYNVIMVDRNGLNMEVYCEDVYKKID